MSYRYHYNGLRLGPSSQYNPAFNPTVPPGRLFPNSRNRAALAMSQFRQGMSRLNRRRRRPRTAAALLRPVVGEIRTRLSRQFSSVSSDATGTVNIIVGFTATSTEFTALASLWDEWKLVAAEIIFTNQQVTTSPMIIPVIIVYDTDDAVSSVGSYQAAMQYSKKVIGSWSTALRGINLKVKIVPAAGNQLWLTTGNGAWPGSFKVYGSGFPASTQVGYAMINMSLVLRGRR